MSTIPSQDPFNQDYVSHQGQTQLQVKASPRATSDECHLMERVCEGNEEALITIYDRYSSLAYRLAFHLLRNETSAEDIVQDVFLRLWRQPENFDPKRGNLSGWIAMNARHRAVDYWRKHSREVQMDDDGLVLNPLNCESEDPADIATVQAILCRLPVFQREVLTLSYFGGFSHSEIVSRTGLPLGTVKSRIRQGLQKIRRTLLPDRTEERSASM